MRCAHCSRIDGRREIDTPRQRLSDSRDRHEFGRDYDRTLIAWWDNFKRAWPDLSGIYSERFYRMWKYYLHCCAAGFRAGQLQLWQIVLSRREARPDYQSIRP